MEYYVFDVESYYDSKGGYSLRKMTTEEYVNDPRFKVFGFSISKNGGAPHWVPEDRIEFMLRQLKLEEHAVIAHNAPFDMAILNWKYGVKPKFIVDTLAMARGVLGNEESLSLENLGKRLGIGEKGTAIVHMDGVRNPSPCQLKKLGEYAKNDVAMTWELWRTLKEGFPLKELMVIDITTRMFTEPAFVLDKKPILRELELEGKRQEELLRKADCTLGDLRSDEKFALLLQNLGVVPPKKLSEKKSAKAGKPVYTWAFAKSDVDFKALAKHDDEAVRWAVDARLGLKSTIRQSRATRFLGIAERMGKLPVSLVYYGASTGRYAAGGAINCQNLPATRGSDDPDVALLRKSLVAPPGGVIIVSDASQIEARLLAWVAGQENVVEAFAEGRDVYAEMASTIFGKPINAEDNFLERFIGKSVVLGCGYGLGHQKFAAMIYTGMLGGPSVLFDGAMAEELGVSVESYARFIQKKEDMLKRLIESKPAGVDSEAWVRHSACAQRIINTFREKNDAIPRFWKTCERMLSAMYRGTGEKVGLFQTAQNKLLLPNGMWLHFKELEFDKREGYSCLRKKEGRVQRVKVYGGGVAENCIAGGTLVLTHIGWVPIEGISISHMVHDGADFVSHGGVVFNQIQSCTVVDGVFMTHDHEVLTNEGWKPALEKPRPYQPNIRGYDPSVQDCKRMPTRTAAGEAGFQKPVYDIVNCGPLSRFVVLGENGPFIVHNCTQALAGAYVKEAMVRMHLKGYRPILQVHDEVVCLADKREAAQVLQVVNECMKTVPSWAEGLPLEAKGDFAQSYGHAK